MLYKTFVTYAQNHFELLLCLIEKVVERKEILNYVFNYVNVQYYITYSICYNIYEYNKYFFYQ